MIQAAGNLFHTDAGRVLFLKRSDAGDHAGEWCLPGGKLEAGETALDAAHRETLEETGFDGDRSKAVLHTRRQADGVDFTTFRHHVDEEFVPVLDAEHVEHRWATVDEAPEPLHPGVRVALDRFSMDELGVAKAIAAGELTSPQVYDNVTLFDLRITGTGQAYRSQLKEHVWRPPEDYLTEEFLARCNGLPVIWLHPEDAPTLNSEEFAKRSVGSIFLPYTKGDEVWGVAKIYDADAIEMMSKEQLSTSPGVLDVGDQRVRLADGSSVLVEEKPRLLDHLAICQAGVWDKGGPPSGVASVITGDDTMTTAAEAKSAEEQEALKRADAEAATKAHLDPLLSKMDALCSKLDSIAGRVDAMEAERKAMKDRRDRRDSLRAKRDAEGGEMNAEEKEELEALEAEERTGGETEKAEEHTGEAAELAADSKKGKRGRKDATPAEKSAEKHLEKGEEEEAMSKAEREKAEEGLREDSARKDAQIAELRAGIDELKRATAPMSDADYAAMSDAQARCDAVAQAFGESAPRPLPGETLLAYRKRLLKPFVKYSQEWAKADASVISVQPAAAFEIIERQVYDAAKVAAKNPPDLAPGTLRMVTRRDQDTGHVIREYYGDSEACWGRFKSPVRKIKGGLSGFQVTNQARN